MTLEEHRSSFFYHVVGFEDLRDSRLVSTRLPMNHCQVEVESWECQQRKRMNHSLKTKQLDCCQVVTSCQRYMAKQL